MWPQLSPGGRCSLRGDRLFRAVSGNGPAASERLLGHTGIPTLAETSHRRIWIDSTRCGDPDTRSEGASGKTSIPSETSEISDGMRHGPPYVLCVDDFEDAQFSKKDRVS